MAEPHGQLPKGDEGTDREIHYGTVWRFTAFVLALIAVSMVLMWGLTRFAKRELASQDPPAPPLAEAREDRLPQEPRLQPAPPKDLAGFRAREEAILGGYAWVDRTKGVARVPVARALEIAVEKGLPVKYGNPASVPAPAGGAAK
jgi:hypothetical protein